MLEYRFQTKASSLPIFVLWHCFKAFFVSCQERGQFYAPQNCAECRGLKMPLALHVLTPTVFSFHSNRVLERSFCRPNFTVAHSNFAVSVATQFLQAALSRWFDEVHFASMIAFA